MPDPLASSFRDPAGFMYVADGELFRQVNPAGSRHYDQLLRSGLYDALVERSWIVPHDEVAAPPTAYRVLKPKRIPYVSYPYEWCFSQLKDAALLTLDIQLLALSRGMALKDASAYNVQFVGARPIFIDTLSFETYEEGAPWVAYRQFCEQFLGPLALQACCEPRLRHLSARFVDGVPLDLVSAMLPRRTWWRYGLLAHLHLHSRSQRRWRDRGQRQPVRIPALPKARLIALMESLRRTVLGCSLRIPSTEWSHYYEDTNYTPGAMAAKEALVKEMVDETARPGDLTHDIGGNIGRFSRAIAGPHRYVVSHDMDEMAVEQNYLLEKRRGANDVLPLVLDVTNPSPSLGWALQERPSALERVSGGTVLALALVHHLSISNNVPFDRLAAFFAGIARVLIVEFVPKDDSQVQRLLATRADIFPDYTLEAFERAFSSAFEITRRAAIPESARTLLAMRRRN